jgi:hypothetical protein
MQFWSKPLVVRCRHHPSKRSQCSKEALSHISSNMIRLKAEGKMLAGGLPVGDRAFTCIIEAASNDEAGYKIFDRYKEHGLEALTSTR